MPATKQQAIRLTEELMTATLNEESLLECGPIVVIDEYTIVKPYGWVFFFNTQKYVKTKDRRCCLIGSGVAIFKSSDSSLTLLPTHLETDIAVKNFEDSILGAGNGAL